VGQLVDLLLIPNLVQQANQPLLQATPAAASGSPPPSLERQLLPLARRVEPRGFTLNDALLAISPEADSVRVSTEIERLLHAGLLDVGNDERGRVVYREP